MLIGPAALPARYAWLGGPFGHPLSTAIVDEVFAGCVTELWNPRPFVVGIRLVFGKDALQSWCRRWKVSGFVQSAGWHERGEEIHCVLA